MSERRSTRLQGKAVLRYDDDDDWAEEESDSEDVYALSRHKRTRVDVAEPATCAVTESLRAEFLACLEFYRDEVFVRNVVHVGYMLEKLNDPELRRAHLEHRPLYLGKSKSSTEQEKLFGDLGTEFATIVNLKDDYQKRKNNVGKKTALKVGDLISILRRLGCLDDDEKGSSVARTRILVNALSFSGYTEDERKDDSAIRAVGGVMGVLEEVDMTVISLLSDSSANKYRLISKWTMVGRLLEDKWRADGRKDEADAVYAEFRKEAKLANEVYAASHKMETQPMNKPEVYRFKYEGTFPYIAPFVDQREDQKAFKKLDALTQDVIKKKNAFMAAMDANRKEQLEADKVVRGMQREFKGDVDVESDVWREAYCEKRPLVAYDALGTAMSRFVVPNENYPVNFGYAYDMLCEVHRTYILTVYETTDDLKVFRSMGIQAVPAWYTFYMGVYTKTVRGSSRNMVMSCEFLLKRSIALFMFNVHKAMKEPVSNKHKTEAMLQTIWRYAKERGLTYGEDPQRCMMSEPRTVRGVMNTVYEILDSFLTEMLKVQSGLEAGIVHVWKSEMKKMTDLGDAEYEFMRQVEDEIVNLLKGQRYVGESNEDRLMRGLVDKFSGDLPNLASSLDRIKKADRRETKGTVFTVDPPPPEAARLAKLDFARFVLSLSSDELKTVRVTDTYKTLKKQVAETTEAYEAYLAGSTTTTTTTTTTTKNAYGKARMGGW